MMDKFAHLQKSNRKQTPKVSVSSFTKEANDVLYQHIQKESSRLSIEETNMDKQAFFSRGMEMFGDAKNLIASKLGMSEDAAHDLTPGVLNQADQIHQQYGGDITKIIDGVVEELAIQSAEHPSINKETGSATMREKSSSKISEIIKRRLINEFGIPSFEADRLKLAVLKEAKDITTILRGKSKEELSHAIIDMMMDRNDPSVVYGLAGNSSLVEDLQDYLD